MPEDIILTSVIHLFLYSEKILKAKNFNDNR